MKKLSIVYLLVCILFSLIATPGFAQEKEGIGETGTDPRDFAPKFMPYYRYTELENELKQQEFVLFGMFAFAPKFAMTYEIPLAMERDIEDVDAFKKLKDEIKGGGAVLPGNLPIDPEGDGKETGVGDMNLRFFVRTPFKFINFDWLVGTELVFPTANQVELASETFIVKPMVTMVRDIGFWPAPGASFALMNFYGFDAWKDKNRDDVSQYIGRYFFMLPIHPSGIYTLPEFQFIYDFIVMFD